MPTITAIEPQKKVKRRFNIFLDGSFAFSLCKPIAHKLCTGQALSPQEISELSTEDSIQECLQAALRFLSYRPRATSEVKSRLLHKKFVPEVIDRIIRQLKERKLLNDDDFARSWAENRFAFSPRSRKMVQAELKQKGVSQETALVATNGIDELDAARRAAAKKARGLAGLDKETCARKLTSFLIRRGFGWGIAKQVVEETLPATKSGKLQP